MKMAKSNDKLNENDKENALHDANNAHREQKLDRNLLPVLEDLGIMSRLIREVDMGRLSMPDARKQIAGWFKSMGPGDSETKLDIRNRMRRLKQIVDAMNEEVQTQASQL